jgi:negative regulator of flagellin synthesis FlgM
MERRRFFVMKVIQNSFSTSPYVNQVKDRAKVDAQTKVPSSMGVSKDRVELSPAVMEIRQAKNELESISEIREEKVAELKERIDKKTYFIDKEKIASEIIKEALLNELL